MHAGSQPVLAHEQAVNISFVTAVARSLNETINPVT